MFRVNITKYERVFESLEHVKSKSEGEVMLRIAIMFPL
jgi:hypothetical protein